MRAWIAYLVVAMTIWALRMPELGVAVLVAWVAWRSVPSPIAFVRAVGRMRQLRAHIDQYPADVTARRDLARMCLERRRADEAVALLEEAIAKGMQQPEEFYLLGLARLRAGDPERALAPIVRSVAENERLFLGDPYFAAAQALIVLRRWAEAEDALDRGLAVNTSNVSARWNLARVRLRRGDRDGARGACLSAVSAWRELPDFSRRKYLRAYLLARVWLLTRLR